MSSNPDTPSDERTGPREFTIGEFVELLSSYPPDHELRFVGLNGEIFFHRLKFRGEALLTIEFDDPNSLSQMGIRK